MAGLLVVAVLCIAAFGDDRVINLPGVPSQPKFAQYAGYVNVDETNGRSMFYWYTESAGNPAKDPLVLWLTGGPGCSSLGAFLGENGPYYPNPDGGQSLRENPWSWNKVANVVWLESPAGVGFSYSNNTNDYKVGDQRTMTDTYAFLQGFLARYPHLRVNDFWVTGESYGGHYVPEISNYVVEQNKVVPTNLKINIKGFQVGNAWTDPPSDNYGAAWFWWTHGTISDDTFHKINASCDFSNIGPIYERVAKRRRSSKVSFHSPEDAAEYAQTAQGVECDLALNQASAEQGDMDIYDLYIDVCRGNNQKPCHLDPCLDNHVADYLNRADVQQAIHVRGHVKWSGCSSKVDYNRKDVLSSVIPIYKKMLDAKALKILVYSGDVDAVVPWGGTQTWLAKKLGPKYLTPVSKWAPWYAETNGKQLGGYRTHYINDFTVSTVRNAGHMVPWYQPQRSFALFSRFLNGTL